MKVRCVLVNPWIYDFAAVNLWSRPLGLLHVAEYLSQFDTVITLIDCTDQYSKMKKFGIGKYPRQIVDKPAILKDIPKNYARYGIDPDDFRKRLSDALPADIVLVSSIMTYWYPGVQFAISLIRDISPDTPVVLGGIYASLFPEHARRFSGADRVFTGHIGHKIERLLKELGVELCRCSEKRPYYELGLYNQYSFAPVATGFGCPYRCSYCASSVLNGGYTQRDPLDVVQDIERLYALGVRDFAFYDDALLADFDAHLSVILEEIIRRGMNLRFHCPNGIHARFVTHKVACLFRRAGFQTIRLSLETVDRSRQLDTGGKVSNESLLSAVMHLKEQGFKKEHIGVYLMYGLPSQPIEEVEEGVKFLLSAGVRIHLTEYSPIPGTLCWDELMKDGLISNETDPLLTNNSVFSLIYSGYDTARLQKIKEIVKQYNNA